jgi:ankyrin repeat protein
MKPNQWIWGVLAILLGVGMGTAGAATNEVSALLQQGLFEEEANQNLDAAIQAYQAVIAQTDKNRQFAATAIFRLGECYRKQGKTNEAAAQYQRILRDFADQTQLAKLSQQNLEGMGMAVPNSPASSPVPDAARQRQKDLLDEEIKVVDQQVQSQQARVKQGVLSPDDLSQTQQKLLELKRQRAALDAGGPVSLQTPVAASDEEDQELARIQAMIENSPDLINRPYAGDDSQLCAAASRGQLRVANYLLDHGAEINGRPGGKPPIIIAAVSDQKTMVELLLNRGADVDARENGSGDTALITAIRSGYLSVVQVLLAHHADVNAKSPSDITPLHLAAQKGYADIAGLLITNGADVNAADNNGYTPLYGAASAGNIAAMEVLIAHKAEVNARANDGRTPLSAAVEREQLGAAALLLKSGADVNATWNGSRPLHDAVIRNNADLVKLLLDNGADPNARRSSYNFIDIGTSAGHAEDVTPLIMAVMNRQPDIVNLLIAHHADANAVDASGDSALSVLAGIELAEQDTTPTGGRGGFGGGQTLQPHVLLKTQLAIANSLLASGADVNSQNSSQQSPLSLAVISRSSELVKLLLQHQAKVDLLDGQGYTPLEWAISQRAANIAGLLLDAGASPNVKHSSKNGYPSGWDGKTPLGMAVANNDKPLVEVLLAHKADPNQPDDQGNTPLSIAKWQQKDYGTFPEQARTAAEITELLLKAGANENLHRLSVIGVSRAGDQKTVFTREPNLPNHFSLLDLVAAFYAPPYRGDTQRGGPLGLNDPPGFAHPDFANITISRLQKNGRTNLIRVDLESVLGTGDCSKDVSLEWGDIVEIPEADHNVNEKWMGLSDAASSTLRKCLAAQVAIMVKGQTNLVTLKPLIYRRHTMSIYLTSGNADEAGLGFRFTAPPDKPDQQSTFWLYDVMHQANVILTSSDLSRVKVTRKDAATRKTIELTLDLRKQDPNPANALWLRDGDVIEIPEKP